MADYLSSVLARATDTPPSLSPRVPTLFEPPAMLLSVPQPTPTWRMTTSSSAGQNGIPTPKSSSFATELQLPEVLSAGAGAKSVRQQTPELTPAVQIKNDSPTREPSSPIGRVLHNRSEPRQEEPTREPLKPKVHDTIRPPATPARPQEAALAPLMLEPALIRSAPQARKLDDPPPAIIAPRGKHSAREPVAAAHVLPSSQQLTEANHQPLSLGNRVIDLPPPSVSETQRPVVNVVIERLSVHAITSATASPRAAAPTGPPSMSLEQYLQRRSARS